MFSARPPGLGVLYCEIILNLHPGAHARRGLTLGELLKTLLYSLGGRIGAPFNGLVEIGILYTKLFQTLFDLRVDLSVIEVHPRWPVDMDSNVTEHPFNNWNSSKPQQMACERCDEEWMMSISANHCVVTANQITRIDQEEGSKGRYATVGKVSTDESVQNFS